MLRYASHPSFASLLQAPLTRTRTLTPTPTLTLPPVLLLQARPDPNASTNPHPHPNPNPNPNLTLTLSPVLLRQKRDTRRALQALQRGLPSWAAELEALT